MHLPIVVLYCYRSVKVWPLYNTYFFMILLFKNPVFHPVFLHLEI